MSDIVYIYSLIDPRNNRPFYIGQSKDADKRLASHRSEQRRSIRTGRATTYKQMEMLLSYLYSGELVGQRILAEVSSDEVDSQELFWINLHMKMGYELINSESKKYQQLRLANGYRWECRDLARINHFQRMCETKSDYREVAFLWERLANVYAEYEYLSNYATKQSVRFLKKSA